MYLYKESIEHKEGMTFKDTFNAIMNKASKAKKLGNKTKIIVDFPIIGTSIKSAREKLGGMIYGSSPYFNHPNLCLYMEDVNGNVIASTSVHPISNERMWSNEDKIVPLKILASLSISTMYPPNPGL